MASDQFQRDLARLKADLLVQAQRVYDLFYRAVESFFNSDSAKASDVIQGDRVIDRVDVDIERASIPLLGMGETDPSNIRSVLTIVKVNNELERIADCGVNIAEAVRMSDGNDQAPPPTFRVMANSVVAMVRDCNSALANADVELARKVLAYDDTVDRFTREILLDAQKKVASGEFLAPFAFRLHTVVRSIERAADHCTNICEQVIYLASGRIVRHLPEGWSAPAAPEEV
jgi:phosphate transport system protein